MKTKSLLLVFLSFNLGLYAQNTDSIQPIKWNEIRVNLTYLNLTPITTGFFTIDYQKTLNKKHAVGAVVGGNFKFKSILFDEGRPNYYTVIFYPYYRYSPNPKKTSNQGFFIESGLFTGYKSYIIEYDKISKPDKNSTLEIVKAIEKRDSFEESFRLGLGGAIGYKSVTKKNFIWEFLLGGGYEQNLEQTVKKGYPRVGILFGKRF